MSRATVHHFRERLDWSNDLSDEAAWNAFYQGVWPDLVASVRVDVDSEAQRAGVDRLVYLPNDRVIRVDEKKRDKDYGDFLAEICSATTYDPSTGTKGGPFRPGWSVDDRKRCDFIAYAVVPASACWLLPFDLLRLTCKKHWREWLAAAKTARPRTHGWSAAKNGGYWTLNVGVPWDRLFSDLEATMRRDWSRGLALGEE